MAQYQSHISFSVVAALGYAFVGYVAWNIYPENILLASVIIIVAGMLPDIDATGGVPERELGGLLAAIAPILVLEAFPGLHSGGVSRIALVVILTYILTRFVVVRSLQKFTSHRGMIHSIPAAIIVFEIAFLLFHDAYWTDRLYLSFAAFFGFFSHLLLDAYTNLDVFGRLMGKPAKAAPALKIMGATWGKTITMYGMVMVLGYFVIKDLYPAFRISASLH